MEALSFTVRRTTRLYLLILISERMVPCGVGETTKRIVKYQTEVGGGESGGCLIGAQYYVGIVIRHNSGIVLTTRFLPSSLVIIFGWGDLVG